jgi:hypothetical protein
MEDLRECKKVDAVSTSLVEKRNYTFFLGDYEVRETIAIDVVERYPSLIK